MVNTNPERIPELYEKFNLAADASVNDRLDEEKNPFIRRPEGAITSSYLGERFDIENIRHLENYLYYYNLIKDKQIENEDYQPNAMLSNIGGHPNESPSEDSNYTVSDQTMEITDHIWNEGNDAFDMEDIVKEFVNQVYSTMNSEVRGLMPASFLEQIEILNKDKVLSWKQILKKYVGTVVAGKRKTRTRLNRRQPERFDISGKVDEKVIKIVVAIDTSASVTNGEIANIFNEIFAILATRKHEITVIECDAEVQKVYKAKKRSDIQAKVEGRGGTSYTPVIEYINNDRYFRDALLIYFTDGGGDDSIPKPLTYRNIWVLTGNFELSLKKSIWFGFKNGE
jgi:predicted metal-dependent peptidase